MQRALFGLIPEACHARLLAEHRPTYACMADVNALSMAKAIAWDVRFPKVFFKAQWYP